MNFIFLLLLQIDFLIFFVGFSRVNESCKKASWEPRLGITVVEPTWSSGENLLLRESSVRLFFQVAHEGRRSFVSATGTTELSLAT